MKFEKAFPTEVEMARHGRAGKNAIPPANRPGQAPETPVVSEELAAEKTKARGRTAKTNPGGPQPTEPHTPQEMRREVSRPQSAGVKKRGDRRDTMPDPGMRDKGHNRSIRTPQSTGKRNITGKRANASRGPQR